VAKRQSAQNQKRLIVSIHHVATSNAERRLRRAIDILLQATGKDVTPLEGSANAKNEEPHDRALRRMD